MDEKETWCLESRKKFEAPNCTFSLTHSGNTVGEGKEGRMLSREKPGVWRRDFWMGSREGAALASPDSNDISHKTRGAECAFTETGRCFEKIL